MMPKITPYINGEATLTNFINYMNYCMTGFMRASISAQKISSVYYLTVKAGSVIETVGELYYFSENTVGTNDSASFTKIYFYVEYQSGLIKSITSVPHWSNTAQGYYGTSIYYPHRHFAVITLDGAGGNIIKTELMDDQRYESYI